jgi:hypothetical protein
VFNPIQQFSSINRADRSVNNPFCPCQKRRQDSHAGETPTPVHNATGVVTSGVEIFQDVSSMLVNLERAKQIQSQNLELDLPDDPRLRFSTFLLAFCGIITISYYFRNPAYLIAFE